MTKKKNVLFRIIAIVSFITFQQISYAGSSNPEKYAVFVVGPGRCGTFCLTGVLQRLGLRIGKDFAKMASNPKGSFEHRALRHNNYEITVELVGEIERARAAHYMFYLPLIDWNLHPKKEIYKNKIKEKLQEVFGDSPLFGFKDPRVSFLLPLYIEAAEELGYIPKVIILLREPREIVASFKKMVPEMHHQYLENYITRCFTAILKDTDECDVMSIEFSKLLNETEKTVDRINKFVPGLKSYAQVSHQLDQFLDKDLKHH